LERIASAVVKTESRVVAVAKFITEKDSSVEVIDSDDDMVVTLPKTNK
jgi:hypothetical protein